jgi:DNA adenine methylase
MSVPTRPILRWHGGKWVLAPWIIAHFPPHRIYVEPFGGAFSVGLRKPRTYAEIWNDLPEGLAFAVERLRGVVIESRPALQVMATHDGPDTLHYVDPPYSHETRARANRRPDSGGVYRHEMTGDEHVELLTFLRGLRGMVVLSGYPLDVYDALLPDWRRVEREALADGALPRTEVLWINPAATARHAHGPLFLEAAE